MKYEKSPLDSFLQQRISNNAEELKNTLNETLQMEQACLEQICLSINLCKKLFLQQLLFLSILCRGQLECLFEFLIEMA